MNFDDAMGVFMHKAGDEVMVFMAEHGNRRRVERALRRRKMVSEDELLEAAHALLQEMNDDDLEDIRDLAVERHEHNLQTPGTTITIADGLSHNARAQRS